MERGDALVQPDRVSLSMAEVAALPLIVPSPGHCLRRRIALEFKRANIDIDPVAEIDSLPLLMHCLADGMGATIKPMAAIHALDKPEHWRALTIADAQMSRTNYLYSLPPQKLSPCAAVVRDELKSLVRRLIESGEWQACGCRRSPRARRAKRPRTRWPERRARRGARSWARAVERQMDIGVYIQRDDAERTTFKDAADSYSRKKPKQDAKAQAVDVDVIERMVERFGAPRRPGSHQPCSPSTWANEPRPTSPNTSEA